jgi:hypothetical protein
MLSISYKVILEFYQDFWSALASKLKPTILPIKKTEWNICFEISRYKREPISL